MSLQLIGLVSIFLGVTSLFSPPRMIVFLIMVSSVFGTAAALLLPALGGSSILVESLFAPFLVARLLLWSGPMAMVRPLLLRGAGLWLLVMTIIAIASSYFLPRIFEGATSTMAVVENSSGLRVIRFVPLHPTNANITQAVYLLGGVAVFCAVFAFMSRTRDYSLILKFLIVVGCVHIAATILDIVTYYSGTAFLLEPIRNANYAYYTAAEKGGLKRLCAFFSEASAFAGFTVILFSGFLSLWIDRIRTDLTGPITAALFLGLLFSTSGAGYVALVGVLAIVSASRGVGFLRGQEFTRSGALVIGIVGAVAATIFAFALAPALTDVLQGFLDETVFGKLESQSGRERMMWNRVALQNFRDTAYLGAGLGSTTASNLIAMLLSNVGIPGAVAFAMFVSYLLFGPLDPDLTTTERGVISALRWSIAGALMVALLTKTVFDFGLLFYLLAGVIASAQKGLGAQKVRPAAAAVPLFEGTDVAQAPERYAR